MIPAAHEHNYSDQWSADENEHWRECECGDKTDNGVHVKEVRNAVDAGENIDGYTGDVYCATCDRLLEKGEVIPAAHEHNYSDQWSADENEHWRECECGDKTDNGVHVEEVRNAVDAGENTDGYTGDVYCATCDRLLEKGEVIPAAHVHEYSENWKTDAYFHWHECNCGARGDLALHEYKDGYCSVCQAWNPKSEAQVPQTGDKANLHMWFALSLLSLFGIICCTKQGLIKPDRE